MDSPDFPCTPSEPTRFAVCSLAGYLQKASMTEGIGGKGMLGAALLSYLGFLESDPKPVDRGDLRELMDMLKRGRHFDTVSGIQDHCKACPHTAECSAGKGLLDD